jgi:hypothetical protein
MLQLRMRDTMLQTCPLRGKQAAQQEECEQMSRWMKASTRH